MVASLSDLQRILHYLGQTNKGDELWDSRYNEPIAVENFKPPSRCDDSPEAIVMDFSAGIYAFESLGVFFVVFLGVI